MATDDAQLRIIMAQALPKDLEFVNHDKQVTVRMNLIDFTLESRTLFTF